ncbi:Hsp70 family protein [Frankia sp. Cas3]|uniref:Hsp70 family protein n=1 Tax=Frankia sp. Cas3 TaxID=3073926 RepID=UPI002AD25ACF|nr:Hsp70 family protein [Frankia sp. Cas3]
MADRPTLGIDLGTTYSCVAHLDEYGKPVALQNGMGEYTTPSVVYFEDRDSIVVGKPAKNELHRDSDRVVQHIKRHMGEADFFLEIDGRDFYPQQISSLILKSIVEDALAALDVEQSTNGQLADVVITVPAYFGGAEREATRKAGEQAGLNVLSIINEPTAAAIAYGLLNQGSERTVLVYDLGGGTFDVTVIKVSPAEIRAIATGGDRELGGADWDKKLIDLFLEKFEEQCPEAGDPRTDTDAVGDLILQAEAAKQDLSRRAKYGMSVTANTVRAKFDVTREEFEELTEDLVERTLNYTDLVLDAARDKGVARIDEAILVGGMSRVPIIGTKLAERLRRRFPDLPDPKLQDPDQIVAKGAALFAASKVNEMYGSDEPLAREPGGFLGGALPRIVNITSRGYGVRTFRSQSDTDGYISWHIRPNDPLPAEHKDDYRTLFDNQTAVDVAIYESATDILNDDVAVNKVLTEAELSGLPPNKPAGQPLKVTFSLGDESILRVHAVGPSNRELHIELKVAGEAPAAELAKPLPKIIK